MASDSRGTILNEGDRVQAWLRGVEYTATVKTIRPHHPGCGDHVHIVLIREDDGTEVETSDDAVVCLN